MNNIYRIRGIKSRGLHMVHWNKESRQYWMKRVAVLTILFTLMYLIGEKTAETKQVISSNLLTQHSTNWGLGFGENGTAPTGTHTSDELKNYNAYYKGEEKEKVIYLTFDGGFENGNTPQILEALKKHEVQATFFLVGNYLESEPELVKQMLEDGHQIGNHSYYHPDMTQKNQTQFIEEMEKLEHLYKEITGEEIASYYRPPQGKYNTDNLTWANEMGYKTIFWSLAYVDWYQDNQPTKEEAFDKLLNRIHPGAIVLLHNTSSTNAQIMDELLQKWKDMGYTFALLDELN